MKTGNQVNARSKAQSPRAASRRRRPPAAPFEVIVLRPERPPEPARTPAAKIRASFASLSGGGRLEALIASGQAAPVFAAAPARSGKAITQALPADVLPDIFSVGASSEYEARELLDQLQEENADSMVFVAPPRHVLARAGDGRRQSSVQEKPDFWGLEALCLPKQAIDASGITIAVVDTGVDRSHPALEGVIDEYVNFTRDSDRDTEGHGTHVCGIIAAAIGKSESLGGVCNARLAVFKGLAKSYSASAYYQALRAACQRARIVNLSLGGPADPVESLIVGRALAAGTLIVAAMGNEFEEGNEENYPAAIPGVIAVGAVDRQRSRARFSNTGPHIDLVAPGVEIWSTAPTYRSRIFGTITQMAPLDGTSMATPFVSGVLALLAATTQEVPWVAERLRCKIPVARCPGQTAHSPELGEGFLYWPGPLFVE